MYVCIFQSPQLILHLTMQPSNHNSQIMQMYGDENVFSGRHRRSGIKAAHRFYTRAEPHGLGSYRTLHNRTEPKKRATKAAPPRQLIIDFPNLYQYKKFNGKL